MDYLLGCIVGFVIAGTIQLLINPVADAWTEIEERRTKRKIPKASVWRLSRRVVSKQDGLLVRIHHTDGEQVHMRPLNGCEPLMFSYKYFIENATRIPKEDLPLLMLAELP